MKTIFMNTENSKTNESHRFRVALADKFKIYFKFTTTIYLKSLLQLGMLHSICLMDHILFQTFKIILNLSSRNTKL